MSSINPQAETDPDEVVADEPDPDVERRTAWEDVLESADELLEKKQQSDKE
jgi:hypothetical protein